MNENRQGSLLDFIEDFTRRFPTYVDEYETLLTDNRIWKQRTVGIGVVTPERAKALGFTGPMLRGSGVEWDLRRKQPYEVYDRMAFDIPIGVNGDCYDRYLVQSHNAPAQRRYQRGFERLDTCRHGGYYVSVMGRLAGDGVGALDLVLQLHQAVQQRLGRWRAPWNVHVDRHDAITAAHH